MIKDNDTASTMDMRLQLFNLIKGERNLLIPNSEKVSSRRRNKPQITLDFSEQAEDVEENYEQVTGEISFRIIKAGNDNDITESQARTFGQKIKSIFGVNDGLIRRQGKELLSYCDWNLGYQV
ncbi:hypothetical protein [Microseira sp. BLCC-F43]|uniref:hypothetical protein n=1 Tax=Microseira sp. BLCC-F43 TaxID=3153602 RepID=UPI0035B79071